MASPNDVLTVNLQQALQVFEMTRIEDIRDIRSIDTDLLVVLRNGQRIVWTEGSLTALQKPDLLLVFKDGTLRVEQLLQQIETIEFKRPADLGSESWWDDGAPVHHVHSVAYPHEVGVEQRWVLI